MKDFSAFKEVIEEIENSPGYKIDNSARDLEISFTIMVVNFGELKNFIESVPIFPVDKKEESKKYQINALRLMVNFLNTAIAFKEHTRNFIRRQYDATSKAFDGKYQEKIDKEFANDSLTKFIEELRNAYDHDNILPIGILSRDIDDKWVSRVVIPKTLLLKMRSFPKDLEFVKTSEEDIDLLETIDKYIHKSIFPWVMAELNLAHKEEFEDLEQLQDKARKLYKE